MHKPLALTTTALLAALAAGPATARADRAARSSLADELGFAAGPATASGARAGQLFDTLDAELGLTDSWTLTLGASATLLAPTAPDRPRAFGDSGGSVFLFSGGVDWDPGTHVHASAQLSASPSSTLLADAGVPFQRSATGKLVRADTLVASTTSSLGGTLSVAYDTASGGRFDTLVLGEVAATGFGVSQRVDELHATDGSVLTSAELRTYCAAHACAKQLRSLLGTQSQSLEQTVLTVEAVETFGRDTDLGLSASAYLYDHDPTNAGFFSLIVAGRRSTSGGSPIAPSLWSLRPSVAQRLGPVRLRAWFERDAYVAGEGHSNIVGLRAELRVAHRFRVWLSLVGERDVDGQGNTSPFASTSLGARYEL